LRVTILLRATLLGIIPRQFALNLGDASSGICAARLGIPGDWGRI
jgi:hypothetical protein